MSPRALDAPFEMPACWTEAKAKTTTPEAVPAMELIEGGKQAAEPAFRGVINARDLQDKTFPEVKELLPGLIPAGLVMICARPKFGKSWFALDLAQAVASGGECLGRACASGGVLYNALEDGQRRIKSRMGRIHSEDHDWPRRLDFATEWPRFNEGGLKMIERWLDAHPDCKLVIFDTFARVRRESGAAGYSYLDDYAALTPLHKITKERDITILLVHHLRKMAADEPLDQISGTQGLAGVADTLIIMRGQNDGTNMYVTGRDIEESERAIAFDKATCRWTDLGPKEEVRRSDTANAISQTLRDASPEALSPKQIANLSELPVNVVQQRLMTLCREGTVIKTERGHYKHA